MSDISLADFKKIKLVVGKIKEVQDVPNTTKLWKLLVEIGGETKQIVAGIKVHYKPEDLVGKLVIIVHNLAPAVICGTTSEGMLLAAKGGEGLSLLTLDREQPTGSIVG